MKFIGGLSMEIYLCHMVMFRVIEKVHLENYILNPHIYYWVLCTAGLLMAILFSWLVKKNNVSIYKWKDSIGEKKNT